MPLLVVFQSEWIALQLLSAASAALRSIFDENHIVRGTDATPFGVGLVRPSHPQGWQKEANPGLCYGILLGFKITEQSFTPSGLCSGILSGFRQLESEFHSLARSQRRCVPPAQFLVPTRNSLGNEFVEPGHL